MEGIGYTPLTFPESLHVPEAVRANEERANQDYVVAWVQGLWDFIYAHENDPDPSAKLAKDAAAGRHRAERARAKASPSRDQRRLTASLWTMAANSLGGPCLPVHLMVRWRSPEHCWTPR